MAPLVEAFPSWQLESRVQITDKGKARKPTVNLKDCQLKEMTQFSCDLIGPPGHPKSRIVCEPIVRMFRKCADGLMVETTAWEDVYDKTT